MDIILREAIADDIDALTRLTNQLGYPVSTAATKYNLSVLQEKNEGVVFVALCDNRVIAWTHVAKRINIETGWFFEINGLVVDTEHRNKGIGKKLVDKVLDWCRSQGNYNLRVRSNTKRDDAHRFYGQLGFAEIKEQKVFEIKP